MFISSNYEHHKTFLILQLGGFYIWTFTYQLIRSSSLKFKALKAAEEEAFKEPNKDLDTNEKSNLLDNNSQDQLPISMTKTTENQTVSYYIYIFSNSESLIIRSFLNFNRSTNIITIRK